MGKAGEGGGGGAGSIGGGGEGARGFDAPVASGGIWAGEEVGGKGGVGGGAWGYVLGGGDGVYNPYIGFYDPYGLYAYRSVAEAAERGAFVYMCIWGRGLGGEWMICVHIYCVYVILCYIINTCVCVCVSVCKCEGIA